MAISPSSNPAAAPRLHGLSAKPALILLSCLLVLSGCASQKGAVVIEPEPQTNMTAATDTTYDVMPQGPSLQPQRPSLEECQGDAMALDASARENGAPVQYFRSAKTLRDCLDEIGPEVARDPAQQQQLMRLQAVVVLNYFKAGQLEQARSELAHFQRRFANKDLYLRDYSSFIDTFSVLLGQRQLSSDVDLALNVNKDLLNELRRQQYWLTH